MIKQYDKVRLTTGETATIVEIISAFDTYVADIDKSSGIETEFIDQTQIKEILR